ncbi:MAG: hypothetical protein ACXWQR_03715 [Ktedonobacterales bacterium]
MSPHITQDLVVVVDTPNHLFNAPDINPFSENVLETLGMSGLTYITRQLQAHRRDWKSIRLVVQMPPDQITPGFELRLTDALRRYCRTKIEDNTIEIHRIRFRSSIGLGILVAIVAVLIIAAYLLFTGVLAGAPQAVQVTIAATISLFAWVSLWDPLEALIFNPIEFMRENYILRRVAQLGVVVEPESLTETSAGATDVRGGVAGSATRSESKG